MCSLIGFQTSLGYVVFSIRDEVADRPTQQPSTIEKGGMKFLLPQDLKEGGTWWCVDIEKKELAVLLNARIKTTQIDFCTSRGAIIPKLMLENVTWETLDLHGINGFQVYYLKQQTWLNHAWDGIEKSSLNSSVQSVLFAASSTLYSAEEVEERRNDLNQMLAKHDFTQTSWEELKNLGTELLERMSCKVVGKKSVSITTFLIESTALKVNYFDNLNKRNYFYAFN